jgi:enoyl-CoA hydratase/carnithine racemase
MSADRVTVTVAGHVATATMSRAEKHNALDQAMFDGLAAAAAEIAATPGVRCTVLCGEGPSFCSGLDVMSFAEAGGLDENHALFAPDAVRRGNAAQRAALDWADLPMPVIAAVHGNCLGGGLQIALGADVRIASPDARLSIREIQWGLIPDMAITETLMPLVRADVAKELTYTGRIVDGEEAATLGLVTRLADDPLAAAHQLAAEIAARSPDATRAAKRMWSAVYAGGPDLELEAELQMGIIGRPNQLAAAVAGMTKQPAEFTDPEPDPPR